MLTFIKRVYRARKFGDPVIIISGLPRSGTSMAMKMLEGAGLPLFSDHVRKADEDNPKGYYEFERVKNLRTEQDKSWLETARGRVIKIVSQFLTDLPDTCFYRVIFMNRDLDEVVASQNKMLLRRGESLAQDDGQIKELFERHLQRVKMWLSQQSNFEVLEVDYREAVEDPLGQSERIRRFLELPLDPQKMAAAVDQRLYRNRR